TIAIVEKRRVGNFAFELFETLAFALNEKIKVHDCYSGGCVSRWRRRSPRRGRLYISAKPCRRGRPWCCRNDARIFPRAGRWRRIFVRRSQTDGGRLARALE